MDKKLLDLKLFSARKANLISAREILKNEFIGIDQVIDQIIDSMTGWYCFNELQDKPLVVNLWGLTGTGKTSVIKRIISILELDKMFFLHDMRTSSNWSFSEITDSLYQNFQDKPYVLLLDEFQQGKTLDETGKASSNEHQLQIWQLLDVGKISVSLNSHELQGLMTQLNRCTFLIEHGAIIEKGILVYDPSDSESKTAQLKLKKRTNYLVEEREYDSIMNLSEEGFKSEYEVGEYIRSLTGIETIKFLKRTVRNGYKPKEINAVKGLIFVAGNIDGAYSMSSSISFEDDADEFHKESLKISVNDIRKALLRLFRKEQLSRLGNIHVIYPSLNRVAYQGIIESELKKVHDQFLEMTGIALVFTNGLKDKIYAEGVVPAQGTRPVFSTVQYMIKSNLPHLLEGVLKRKFSVSQISIDFEQDKILASYLRTGQTVFTKHVPYYSSLDTIRNKKKDDYRHIVAVHEAGHIIASILLLKKIPKKATSISISSDNDGFVRISQPKTYFKNDVLNWISVLLAGGVAEKQVFGDEHLPMGTESDYTMATNYIVELIKEGVLNEVPGIYHHADILTNSLLHVNDSKINEEAEKWLLNAQKLCEATIITHEAKLLLLADKLLQVNYLNEKDIKEFAQAHFGWEGVESNEGLSVYAASFEKRKNEIIGIERNKSEFITYNGCLNGLDN